MMTHDGCLASGTPVMVQRIGGEWVHGVIGDGPLEMTLPLGEFYRVLRTAPIEYMTRKSKHSKVETRVVLDELGMYARDKIKVMEG